MPKVYFSKALTGEVHSVEELRSLVEQVSVHVDPIGKHGYLWLDDELVHRGKDGNTGPAAIAWDENPWVERWGSDPVPGRIAMTVEGECEHVVHACRNPRIWELCGVLTGVECESYTNQAWTNEDVAAARHLNQQHPDFVRHIMAPFLEREDPDATDTGTTDGPARGRTEGDPRVQGGC